VEADQRIEDLQQRLAAIEVNKVDRIIALLEQNSSPAPSSSKLGGV
jgi:hypothetical protein